MKRGFRINPNDNVAIVLEAAEPGDWMEVDDLRIEVNQRVPMLHKIALTAIFKGEPVKKFGESIGNATCDIAAGEHVHLHNLTS